MQQEIPLSQGSKLICETHKSLIEFLYFGDIGNLKSRLFCSKCIIKGVNSEHIQPSLILLDEFLLNPGNQIMQITSVNGSIIKQEDSQQAKDIGGIEQLLSKLEDIVQQQILQIRQNIIQLKTQLGQDYQEVSLNLKLDEVVQLLQQLRQLDSDQGTNDLVLLEEKLNYVSENVNKCPQEKIQSNQKILYDKFSSNFKIIQNEFDMINKLSFDRIQNLLGLVMPPFIYEDIGQFPQIHYLLSQGRLIQYQLLYQGSRDVKFINHNDLLNGNRFGGYSPCLISNTSEQRYGRDPTMKSFVFQYNKKEIYKLKSSQYHLAVYCSPHYGPTYGSFDIYVAGRFDSGHTIGLGSSYDISEYNIIDKATHIFGDKSPNLQEIKVYKVK